MTSVEHAAQADRGVIVALIPDVFFSVTVRSTIQQLGYRFVLAKSVEQAAHASQENQARLVIADGTAIRSAADWDALGRLTAAGTPVLVFGPHKDVDVLRAAKQANVTRVVANSLFHREMTALVERYALPDDAAPAT